MGNAPSLGNLKGEQLRQLFRRLSCHGISPGPKRHQQFSFFVKCHIPMHHGRKTDGPDGGKSLPIPLFHLLCHVSITFPYSIPDIRNGIGPDAVHILVFPVMTARSNGIMFFIYQYGLNSCGAKLYSQSGSPFPDCCCYLFFHHLNPLLYEVRPLPS